ncbi:MAG: hypothetical protein ACJAVV_001945 [Alphaproteobacteria bacterium]|jgi:hypothetical protein
MMRSFPANKLAGDYLIDASVINKRHLMLNVSLFIKPK